MERANRGKCQKDRQAVGPGKYHKIQVRIVRVCQHHPMTLWVRHIEIYITLCQFPHTGKPISSREVRHVILSRRNQYWARPNRTAHHHQNQYKVVARTAWINSTTSYSIAWESRFEEVAHRTTDHESHTPLITQQIQFRSHWSNRKRLRPRQLCLKFWHWNAKSRN